MEGTFPVDRFWKLETPFYYYDTDLLRRTLEYVNREAGRDGRFRVHYAVKANANPKLLRIISAAGLGADCVSGGEIEAALRAGFPAGQIVYAGVGKTDREISLALEAGIGCFNVESVPEMAVISSLAEAKGLTARIALRVNPDVGAHTHAHITTGLAENKFGIPLEQLDETIEDVCLLPGLKLTGLHFHIGSQILEMNDFIALCGRVNELQEHLSAKGVLLEHVNVGGGLGVDYDDPERRPFADYAAYFDTFRSHLRLRPEQTLHFELGRSVVAQCGSLVSRVLYVKVGTGKHFAILDAGMTDLIRPALYQARHRIENLTSDDPGKLYDVVGPICESSDVFGHDVLLPRVHRGDLLAIRSAGAYGEAMASCYNCRPLPRSYTTEDLR